ncbi:hypothetical protein [Lutimonas sp.]|uniref:hypothetical protein n=1 Tax=Lutimonas sp. TaxID=1872403 RepID=UPI003C776DDB
MADQTCERLASGEGLQDALHLTPTMLFQTDEIDGLLQSISKSRDARYEQLMSTLLTMYLSHWRTPDLSKLNRVTISKARPHQEMHFSVDNIRAKGEYRLPTEEQLQSRFFPFVDKFVQYCHAEWPGKTTSQDDIDSQHQAELKDLASNRGPENWNQYGGWTSGPQPKATGHFRTQKLDEKWWLVDPSGRLFWSQGVTGGSAFADHEYRAA